MTSHKKEIETREDVFLLVDAFYDKVRVEPTLGPIFNGAINDWPKHLEHLTTFWETSLLFNKALENKYKGNPIEAHIKVDAQMDNSISELHFGLWLNLWVETLDEHFEGDIAAMAKRRARKMASFLYLNIFEARQHH
ncbi:group III truncated hemoglobin [Bizionia gelidisalsuginis]|uniref:Group III truncated hemoglobin n=2 Tax=Bizionia TaxID=283785 RepID=A0A8H2LF94_9FLAO|nr:MULTISPECIES: group III truncated hemoglobin [Bizionia]TYB71500.1 group III truncated hemoglobin [Bizionia saleffrena]TYC10780.1 group III truncated hemoglobin [Bizionia gelidisalsuginis]